MSVGFKWGPHTACSHELTLRSALQVFCSRETFLASIISISLLWALTDIRVHCRVTYIPFVSGSRMIGTFFSLEGRPLRGLPYMTSAKFSDFYLRQSRAGLTELRFSSSSSLFFCQSSKEGQACKINHLTTSMKGIWTMTKPMMRSDLDFEAIWRPKQPQRISLKKSGCS